MPIVTMVFCNPRVFEAGMRRLYDTVPTVQWHVVFDAHYPLERPNIGEFLAQKHDEGAVITSQHLDAGENRGLHENANYVLGKIDPFLDDEDVVIFYDADEGPTRAGWFEAMRSVFKADPTCGWLSLNAPPIREVLNDRKVPIVEVAGADGVRVRVPPFCLMNLVCGWRVGALRKIGPLNEPHKWYGGLELDAQPKFRAAGYWVGWLEDFDTQPHGSLADATYTEYKRRHVGHDQPVFTGSFEEWLKRE